MSWRIEEADALTLLRELPSGWAQTCVTRPPRQVPFLELIAVLEQVRRVLRADGTLWLALPRSGTSRRILDWLEEETAWRRTERPRMPAASNVTLFTKQARYLHHHRLLPAVSTERRRCARSRLGLAGARAPRRAFCVPASSQDRLFSRGLIDWCVLTSTAMQACAVCGTPWRRAPASSDRGERWLRACDHLNGRGRSLVIDPWCGSGSTGVVAQLRGRDFLGIEQSPMLAALARRRLSLTQPEAVR
jgi:hypothetical protein